MVAPTFEQRLFSALVVVATVRWQQGMNRPAESGGVELRGGESVEAVKASGYADRISHISTGGGASLEFISGAPLPGVEVLRK